MNFKIEEKYLKGFNAEAKNELKKTAREYIENVIKESNRIESASNSTCYNPEITSSMVNDAKLMISRGFYKRTKNTGVIITRISAAILSAFSGILYDKTLLQKSWYMLMFILIITTTIIMVTFSTIKE